MSKQFTAKEVQEHNTVEKGLHIIIDNDVYEMAGFVDEHPGGAKILKRVGGKDASKQFWKVRYIERRNGPQTHGSRS
jgi:cytochrome b involved in lipid metabolism